MKLKKVHLIGLGAIGGVYAAEILKRNQNALSVIAHGKRAQNIKENGFSVNGENFKPNVESTPIEPAELIIVAVKYPQLNQAMEDMKAFVGPKTIILSLLNGISSEKILGERFGEEKLIYAFGIALDAYKQGNEISSKDIGRVVFGEKYNQVKSERILAIEEFFKKYQIPHEIPEDMLKALWFKFMLNAGVNQVSTVLEAPFIHFKKEGHARDLMRNVAREVVEISQKKNINLTENDIETMVEIISKLNPSGKTSMLQDFEAGRMSEVDFFAGEVMKMGKELDVPTPYNEIMFDIIKFKESLKWQ